MDAELPIPNEAYEPGADDLRDRDWSYGLAREFRSDQENKLRDAGLLPPNTQ